MHSIHTHVPSSRRLPHFSLIILSSESIKSAWELGGVKHCTKMDDLRAQPGIEPKQLDRTLVAGCGTAHKYKDVGRTKDSKHTSKEKFLKMQVQVLKLQ